MLEMNNLPDTDTLPVTADLDSVRFNNEKPVLKASVSLPSLIWFNRLPREDGQGNADGFHVRRHKYPALDAFLEAQEGVFAYNVIHEQTGKIVEYWRFSACSLLIVCEGVMGPFEMNTTEERTGIAYSWNEQKKQSKLRLICYVHELVVRGYQEPFQLSIAGTITKSMFECLAAQDRVLEFYKSLRRKQKKVVDEPYFFSFSLPIAPARQKEAIGQAKVLPMLPMLPAELTGKYLQKRLCPPELLEKIKDELPETVKWSVKMSKKMLLEEDVSTDEASGANSPEPGEENTYSLQEDAEFSLGEEEPEPDPLISPTDLVILRKRLTEVQKQQLYSQLGIADLAELKAEQAQQILAKLQAKKATKPTKK